MYPITVVSLKANVTKTGPSDLYSQAGTSFIEGRQTEDCY
jgi:hypothetical protein